MEQRPEMCAQRVLSGKANSLQICKAIPEILQTWEIHTTFQNHF